MYKIEKYKKYIPWLVIAIISVSMIYVLFPREEATSDWEELPLEQSETITLETTTDSTSEKLLVDIKGEVKKPGVYELHQGSRVEEVILLAGGFTDKAEERQLNLAEKLTDQQMIYVPNKEEAKDLPIPTVTTASEGSSPMNIVNINTATLTELQTLTGIGPSKAQAIIDYREENGNFKSIAELQEVNGFGEKTVEKLKESITV
ncbi:helix-hairpin-helix domain-containing protein [Enterococcus saccharolyticus]|uniref:helix-hairpin-helix domain-containing protein n=1 Tax=Enterococcus saccharolyticus TaxID=41997 RepID=UPI0039E05B66